MAVKPYGCGDLRGVGGEVLDDLAHRHIAARIAAAIRMAWKPALPVRREEAQRIPALVAPGVRHLTALEQDVIDRARAEEVTDRKAGVTGTDHDRREVSDGESPPEA